MARKKQSTENILLQGLGNPLTREDAYKLLLYFPPKPQEVISLPKHLRLQNVMEINDFNIPSLESARIFETIDLLLRQSYRYRDPFKAETWSLISGEPQKNTNIIAPAMCAVAAGHSGTGKTRSIQRALGCYPQQLIIHEQFPNILGPHPQVVWLSVDVPASGKTVDLAANLMNAWHKVMKPFDPECLQFEDILAKDRRDGMKMLDEWSQVAMTHFLGFLHLDEVQNFFKLATLKKRRTRNRSDETPELSIVEDGCLRWILTILNTWKIPVFVSGTLDGVGALTKRLSTTERITTGGYHKLQPFTKSSKEYNDVFFKQLIKYQFVKKPLPDSQNFRDLIIDLTAGIPRLIIQLWIFAHRIAFERREDSLRFEDFEKASKTYQAPLKPAIAALNSGDPVQMARFDDLLPRDDGIWSSFWDPTD